MQVQKRQDYLNTMTLNGIDTLSGYVETIINVDDIEDVNVVSNIKTCVYDVQKQKTYLMINPNKNGKQKERLITKYSQFIIKMNKILKAMNLSLNDFEVVRCDLCFNSDDVQSYQSYQKIHRLLISCLAKAYKFKNCYVTDDLFDFERLSIAIKKDDCEIENYNKSKESNNQSECANRLELRSKRMVGTTIEYQFMKKWFERLDNAQKYFEDVQVEYNNHLEQIYKSDLMREAKYRIYVSLDDFLLKFKECIYTRKQMIDLLRRFESVSNPVRKADKFKEKHDIEYFSKKDLKIIIEILKKKTEEYFNA